MTEEEKAKELFNNISINVMGVVYALGVIGNVIAVLVILGTKKLRSKLVFVLMVVLGFSDTLYTIAGGVHNWIDHHYDTRKNTIKKDFIQCALFTFTYFFSSHFSVSLLVLITIERYCVLHTPFREDNFACPGFLRLLLKCKLDRNTAMKQTYKMIIGTMATLLVIIVVQGIVVSFREIKIEGKCVQECFKKHVEKDFSEDYPDDYTLLKNTTVNISSILLEKFCSERCHGCYTSEKGILLQTVLDNLFYSALPTILIACLNFKIMRKLQKAKIPLQQENLLGTQACQPEQTTARRQTHRATTRMLVVVTTVFIIQTAPISLFTLWYNIAAKKKASNTEHFIRQTFLHLGESNHCLNLLLYVAAGRAFRASLKEGATRLLMKVPVPYIRNKLVYSRSRRIARSFAINAPNNNILPHQRRIYNAAYEDRQLERARSGSFGKIQKILYKPIINVDSPCDPRQRPDVEGKMINFQHNSLHPNIIYSRKMNFGHSCPSLASTKQISLSSTPRVSQDNTVLDQTNFAVTVTNPIFDLE